MILHWKKYSKQLFLTSVKKAVRSFIKFRFRLSDRAEILDNVQINFRKFPQFKLAKRNDSTCAGCCLCEQICPTECIKLNLKDGGQKILSFDLDILSCVQCGLCEEVCSPGMIKLERSPMIFQTKSQSKIDLLNS